jgi:hypothetical protein
MSDMLTDHAIPSQTQNDIDWGEITERLAADFPSYPASDIIAELVSAHEAAQYVGTSAADLAEVVEFMATYAMKVRAGLVTPSDRLDPERHATPRRAED